MKDFFKNPIIDELLRCILICSEARIVRVGEEDKIMSNFQEEKVLLKFAKSCQFSIEYKSLRGKKGTGIQIKTRNKVSQYHILGQSISFVETGKFSVVATTYKGYNPALATSKVIFSSQNTDLDEAVIYIKGTYNKIRHILKVSDDQAGVMDLVAERMYQNGKVPVIFAKKKLSREQAQDFIKKYKNFKTNLNVQLETLEKMFEELETNLTFIGMCTLSQKCVSTILQTVQTINAAGINLWVVSNDPFEKILLLLRNYQLLQQSNSHFYIDGESQEAVAVSVKLHMSQFRKVFELEKQNLPKDTMSQRLNAYYNSLSENVLKRMNSYVIIISGKAFEFIRHDKLTYDNFAFLCAVSARVIGFNFSSENKQALIRMAKAKFSSKTQVMAIGATYSDIPMLNAADIGVFSTNFNENSFLPWADFKTSDIVSLPKLLLEQGVAFTYQIDDSIYYQFYKSVALSLPLFYYNWYSSMTGTPIYDSVLLFLFNFLFTILPLLSLSLDQPFSKEYINMFPAFYAESRSKKLHLIKKFILRVVIEGVVHATLVFYLCLYHVCDSADSHADPGDLGMLSIVMVMSLVFIVDFKVSYNIFYGWHIFLKPTIQKFFYSIFWGNFSQTDPKR